jgi:hypothetical protein
MKKKDCIILVRDYDTISRCHVDREIAYEREKKKRRKEQEKKALTTA